MTTLNDDADTEVVREKRPLVDLRNSFDQSAVLSGVFLWLLFSFLSTLVNCDLQRMMRSNMLVLHFVSIISFFFLFSIIDSSNNSNLLTTWINTFIVYALFLLATKSKWYFVIPVLLLLLTDQSLKKHAAFEAEHGTSWTAAKAATFKLVSQVLNAVTIVLIIIGAVHYMTLQYAEYGPENFSFTKFIFGTGLPCKPPNLAT